MPKKPDLDPSNWNNRRAAERLETELQKRAVRVGDQFITALAAVEESLGKNRLSFPLGVALLGLIVNKAMKDKGFTLEQTLVYNEQAIETFYKLGGNAAVAPPESPQESVEKIPSKVIDALNKMDSGSSSSTPGTIKRYTEFSCAVIAAWLIHDLSAGTAKEIASIITPFVCTAKRAEPSFTVESFKFNLCQILIRGNFPGGSNKYKEALIVATLPL